MVRSIKVLLLRQWVTLVTKRANAERLRSLAMFIVLVTKERGVVCSHIFSLISSWHGWFPKFWFINWGFSFQFITINLNLCISVMCNFSFWGPIIIIVTLLKRSSHLMHGFSSILFISYWNWRLRSSKVRLWSIKWNISLLRNSINWCTSLSIN